MPGTSPQAPAPANSVILYGRPMRWAQVKQPATEGLGGLLAIAPGGRGGSDLCTRAVCH